MTKNKPELLMHKHNGRKITAEELEQYKIKFSGIKEGINKATREYTILDEFALYNKSE